MLKKFLATTVATAAVVTLVSCSPAPDFSYSVDTNPDMQQRINLSVVMAADGGGRTGIANNQDTPINLAGVRTRGGAANTIIAQGGILPAWTAIGAADLLNVNFTNALEGFPGDWTNDAVNTAMGTGITDVDLFGNSRTNIQIQASGVGVINLAQAIEDGHMPNFGAFLEENQLVRAQLTEASGGIYFTPFFDGLGTPERTFMMNVDFISALLDRPHNGNATGMTYVGVSVDDETPFSTNGRPLSTQTGLFADFEDGITNVTRGANTTGNMVDTLRVATTNATGEATYVTIQRTIEAEKDIFTRTEALVENTTGGAANVTGEAFVNMFLDYIWDTYGDWLPGGTGPQIWDRPSEIFSGYSAIYNADELITLMRAVRLNTEFLTGVQPQWNAGANVWNGIIHPFVIRDGNANRQQQILTLGGALWGVAGLHQAGGRFFVDHQGNLQSAMSRPETLYVIDNLHLMYSEGLIANSFYMGAGGTVANAAGGNFLSQYGAAGRIFMTYDFTTSATQSANRSADDARAANWITNGFMPVLPPVARWNLRGADGTEGNAINTRSDFVHLTHDMRLMRNEGWALLNRENRTEAETIRALTVMDRMFDFMAEDPTELSGGRSVSNIINYGPYHWHGPDLAEDDLPENKGLAQSVLNLFPNQPWGGNPVGWAQFVRRVGGISLPIGHVRSNNLELAFAPKIAQKGLANQQVAIEAGVLLVAQAQDPEVAGFLTSVLSAQPVTSAETAAINGCPNHTIVNSLFAQSGATATNFSLVVAHGWVGEGREPRDAILNAMAGSRATHLNNNRAAFGRLIAALNT